MLPATHSYYDYRIVLIHELLLICFQARHKLADSKVAASTADRQQKELEARLEQSRAEAANLKSQQAETQHSHEEELQSLRHTMQLVSEHMRTAQKEFDSNLQASAAKLSALKADSEQKTEELARQLGESDFALRQLRGQLDTALSTSSQKQDSSEQEQQKEKSEGELEAVTQELGALKAQHQQSLLRHESSVSEYDESLKQHSADNTELKGDVADLQTQLAAAEQQLVQSREAAEKVKGQLQAKAAAAEETAAKLCEMQQQVQSQQPDPQEARVVAMEGKLQSLQTESADLEQEVVDLKIQLDQSRQQVPADIVCWASQMDAHDNTLIYCAAATMSMSKILLQLAASCVHGMHNSNNTAVKTVPCTATALSTAPLVSPRSSKPKMP